MDKQPEALRLADQLRDLSTRLKTPSHEKGVCNGAIQELRRLHDVELHSKQLERGFDKLYALNQELLAVLDKLEYSSGGYIKRYPDESEVCATIAKAEAA